MKFEKQIIALKKTVFTSSIFWACSFVLSLFLFTDALSVTSKITRQSSNADFAGGKSKDVITDSKGTIKLSRASELLVKDFKDTEDNLKEEGDDYTPWSINCIVPLAESIYIGTSPNGGIYQYKMGKLSKIYPIESNGDKNNHKPVPQEPNDANAVEAKEYLKNEHIFAMAVDVSGRLLAGISGGKCVLYRFEKNSPVKIYEPNGCKYIFDIEVAEDGDIYLATGPEGKIYHLDSFGRNPELVFDSTDKNILSLVSAGDNILYAGSDTRGLVYQIDTRNRKVKVLYDSEQPEITAMLLAENENNKKELYAAATSAKVVATEDKFAFSQNAAGRPEVSGNADNKRQNKSSLNLKIANTKGNGAEKKTQPKAIVRKQGKAGKASYIYKIDKEGFVTEVFTESAVFFSMDKKGKKLLLGTGNNGRLFEVEPATERKAIIYEDKQASQITAVAATDRNIYIVTANPAKLIQLSKDFADEGTYSADLIDGGQPTKWGKLQIEADIPTDCKVLMSCRSGNVKDINDPTFTDWTKEAELKGPVQMQCPLGRFLQYKLILKSAVGKKTPVIREVAVANTIPNLKPVVESVNVERLGDSGKEGLFKISYKAKDDNSDKLIYKIDFRKLGRTNWIKLKEDHEKNDFQWDGKTVEDGRYEIRITANDVRANTPQSGLTGSRVSEPVVVDNTGPVIEKSSLDKEKLTAVLKLKTRDALSAIEKVQYTVNSNSEWKSSLPDDKVYDTTEEEFTIEVKDLDEGENVIAVKVMDKVGNTTYKSFQLQCRQD